VHRVLLLLALAACSRPSVTEHVDELLASGKWTTHNTMPSPARLAELQGGEPVDSNVVEVLNLTESGRAILDLGEEAVDELAALLRDPDRRTLAAACLGEIGGERAATELWQSWRVHRGEARKVSLYRLAVDESLAMGYRYEGIDPGFYGELLYALAYAGRARGEQIASDTITAMVECERLVRKGKQVLFSEEREIDGVRLEARWSHHQFQTAREGLEILAMCGAPEADVAFQSAFRLQGGGLHWTAIQAVSFLGPIANECLPEVLDLVDDPEYGEFARRALADLLDGGKQPPDSGARAYYEKRLAER
jgi:hypothetical protein